MFPYLIAAAVAADARLPAQGAPAEFQGADERKHFEQLNARWLKSYEQRDPSLLQEILADNFIGIYSRARLTKMQLLERVRTNSIQSIEWKDVMIEIDGDTAVVTGKSAVTSMRDGKPLVAHYDYADVFRRTENTWRAVASHVVPIDPE